MGTIIVAPSAMKNNDSERDAELHQTGRATVALGMKSHRHRSGQRHRHTVAYAVASAGDVIRTGELRRIEEPYGDSGYTGAVKRLEIASDVKKSKEAFRTSFKKGDVKAKSDKAVESQKLQVRCEVEHPSSPLKRSFSFCRGSRDSGRTAFASFPCSPLPAVSCAHAQAGLARVMPENSASNKRKELEKTRKQE